VIDWTQLPWAVTDRIVVDGACPFYMHHLSSRGRRPFDGETRHRLVAV
jgi:hypothetical protein